MAFTNDLNDMPGLFENEFFDFAAASIETPSIQDNGSSNMASQAQPAQLPSILPLTQAEIETIIRMRKNKEAAQEKYERENPFAFGLPAPNYDNYNEGIHIPNTTGFLDTAFNPEQTTSSPIVSIERVEVVTPNTIGQSEVSSLSGTPIWKPRNRCPVPGCSSRAKFQSLNALNTHITNIHDNPLLCTEAGCYFKTPFGRASDLRRHVKSAHNSGVREFVCRLPSCLKEFARQDHLTKHMRDQHTTYPCPFNHCRDAIAGKFVSPEEVQNHILNTHGNYECALGNCAKTPSSGFGRDGINFHLAYEHCYHDAFWSIVSRAEEAPFSDVVTITQDYLGICRFRECKKCGEVTTTNATMAL